MHYRDLHEAISRNTPTGKFLAQFEDMRTDPYEPMLGVGRDYAFDSVAVTFNLRPLNARSIVLQSLAAANPKAGTGSTAMQMLCTVADRCGVELLLSAGPYSTRDTEAMSRDKLMAWYGRFGFEPMNDPEKPSEMRREPKARLAESLDRPLSYEWTIREPRKQQAEFTIDEVRYWVMAYETRGTLPSVDHPEELWIIQFGIDRETSMQMHGHAHGIMEPTKLGRQFSVLSTVRAIIDEFIAQEQPATIWFSALAKMAGSRLRLYRLFAEYVATKHGYHFDEAVMQHFAEGGVWLLRRDPPSTN